ncbi:MAG: PaaI family thioesterase [Halieaceae bacterium]|nr:PaaI family thioesterase [Halieaceae bacterium]
MQLDQLQTALDISPFHRWLGLQAKQIHEDGIELCVPWREEMVSNPAIQSTHGGILASIIDLSGLFAIIACGGSVITTADLHVDYHKAATPGDLFVESKITKIGRRSSTANTRLFNGDRKLLASGRGLYLA